MSSRRGDALLNEDVDPRGVDVLGKCIPELTLVLRPQTPDVLTRLGDGRQGTGGQLACRGHGH